MVRVLPFVIFLILTALQGKFGEESRYWLYAAKTVVGAWMIWVVWPLIKEMRWNLSWEAVATGVGVFVMWVGLDGMYPSLEEIFKMAGLGGEEEKQSLEWNPHAQFGVGSGLAWFFILTRIAGSTLVVPHLEEVFYRSFLYRWIARPDFESVPLGEFNWRSFLLVSAIFGVTHSEWLAGILCGFAYQWLVIRKKRLGDAMAAHAITNLLLGIWVVWHRQWNFW